MHQMHPILSSLNILTIPTFDLVNFSISCREIKGQGGRRRGRDEEREVGGGRGRGR